MVFKDLSDDSISNGNNFLDEIIYVSEKVELNVFIYNEDNYFEEKYSDVTNMLSVIRNNLNAQCIWIEVNGSIEHRHDIVQQLGTYFGLHQLTIEDIQMIKETMKLEIFDDGIYLLMKMIFIHQYNQTNIQQQQISFYLTDNLLITFQEKDTSIFLPIKQRIANNRRLLTKVKSDYLFYSLIDIIIDNYFIVLDLISRKIEDIDSKLMQMTSLKIETLKLIYNIKHDILHFRIVCSPLQYIITKLKKAYDQLPRKDPFAVRTEGTKRLKKKRGRRPRQIIRQRSLTILQMIKIREETLSQTQTILAQRRISKTLSSNDDETLLHKYIDIYLKNLHDRILQINDTIETYSEMIEWLIRFYMILSENLLQKKIKLLTMINSIFHPLLSIHGLNSMNFVWVPQRDNYHNSYFIVLGIIALIVLSMITCFKVNRWF